MNAKNLKSLFTTYSAIVVAIVCFGAFAVAIALQVLGGKEPCPLCIVQRYFILGTGIMAVLWWLVRLRSAAHSSSGAKWARGATAVMAMGGLATALRHMWVQAHPPENVGCLPGLDFMLEKMPLTRALPLLFRGSADCSVVDRLPLGLTIPQASALVFMLVLALVASNILGNSSEDGRR